MPIFIDSIKLKQILINLVNNALKFTEKGKIDVEFIVENNLLSFFVSDTGIGIFQDKQQVIFERFIQIRSNSSQTYEGTGLGLSIVKGLLNILGGNIWLESEPGNGSVFYVSVPYISL